MEVFFYGLYMDEDVLLRNGIHPSNPRMGYLNDYGLKIGNRASLIPCEKEKAYGIVMTTNHEEIINKKWIISNRGKKNPVDPQKPYAWIVEKERTISGKIEDTASIFLTNSECPFYCLMCDLWKNTTDFRVEPGAIPHQINYALQRLPHGATQLKLYNSGNFFDKGAIPESDYRQIAGPSPWHEPATASRRHGERDGVSGLHPVAAF